MLKKIAVQDVRLGMYIHAFAGSWLDHPFWRSKFLLEDPADLQLVRQSAVREVWIDVSKGADAAAEAMPVAQVASAEQVEEALRQDRAVERSLEPTSTASELMRAAAICKSAKHAITSMFTDARMGKAIDQAVARQVAEDAPPTPYPPFQILTPVTWTAHNSRHESVSPFAPNRCSLSINHMPPFC